MSSDLVTLTAPISDDYMSIPVQQGFAWVDILHHAIALTPRENYYLVVFRSKLKADTDRELVKLLDEAAHTEAKRSLSLVYYFAGTPKRLIAMSWCLWTDMAEARRALHGSAHRTAAGHAQKLYDSFSLEVYHVSLVAGRAHFEPVERPVQGPHSSGLITSQ